MMAELTAPKPTRLLLALLLALSSTAALAQERPRRQGPPPAQPQQQQQTSSDQNVLRLLPADAASEHSIEVASGRLDYTATAGTLSLFDQTGERSAAVFYTAYVAKS